MYIGYFAIRRNEVVRTMPSEPACPVYVPAGTPARIGWRSFGDTALLPTSLSIDAITGWRTMMPSSASRSTTTPWRPTSIVENLSAKCLSAIVA